MKKPCLIDTAAHPQVTRNAYDSIEGAHANPGIILSSGFVVVSGEGKEERHPLTTYRRFRTGWPRGGLRPRQRKPRVPQQKGQEAKHARQFGLFRGGVRGFIKSERGAACPLHATPILGTQTVSVHQRKTASESLSPTPAKSSLARVFHNLRCEFCRRTKPVVVSPQFLLFPYESRSGRE